VAAVNPKLKARQVLADLRIESPELLRHLKEICCERGAFVREGVLKGAEARLVVSGSRGIITVNPAAGGAHPGRMRFSVGHELGHFECHRDAQQFWNCSARDMTSFTPRPPGGEARSAEPPRASVGPGEERPGVAVPYNGNRELEANEFAAELLMPEKFLKAQVRRERPSLPFLKELASVYSVSLSAIAYRFVELTNEACAVVFSRAGAVTHSWKSPVFERQGYWIDAKPLDQVTFAHAAHQGRAVPRFGGSVPARAWFQPPEELANETVHEQSEFFRGPGMGISLLWVPSGPLLRA
jgi:hypothetical protein